MWEVAAAPAVGGGTREMSSSRPSSVAARAFLTDGCTEAVAPSPSEAGRLRMASGDADWRQWRAATAQESLGRMRQVRTEKLEAGRRLLELRRASSELHSYSRSRFGECSGQPAAEAGGCCGQSRGRLMNELRLRQPARPIRFRHDRTAQELVQEGQLASRRLVAPYPWPGSYKFSPAPRPQLAAWACAQASEISRRLLDAEEQEQEEEEEEQEQEEEDQDGGKEQQQQQQQVEIELAAAAAAVGNSSLPQLEESRPPASRKASAKKATKQRSKSQSSLKRHEPGPFSVSSVGEEQAALAQEETQLLAEVVQRMRDREAAKRQAAEAAAEAAAAAAAAESQQHEQQQQEQQQQQQQQEEEAAAAPPAAGDSDKKSKRKKSAGSRKGSAGSGGRKKQEASATPPRKASPKARAKSPKARAKSPKARAKSPKGKKEEAPLPLPQPPPLPPAPEEPPPKDAVDLLLDEIQDAVLMFKVTEGELPAFPCPSSEGKSRQHLTRLWWRQHSFNTPARPSTIT